MREPQKTNPTRQIAATELPTRWGVFRALGFERGRPGQRSPETALVLVLGDLSLQAPLVRIHSQCITVSFR
jgi:GTP cyclohydrolase II